MNISVGDKLLCKRIYYYRKDYLTAGKTYQVIRVEIENQRPGFRNEFITEDILGYFWIVNNHNLEECYYVYQSDKELTRTYKKWFYTKEELRKFKLNRIVYES
jgi:hypothetical protein